MIRRCGRHSVHHSMKFGCPLCPDELDAFAVSMARDVELLERRIRFDRQVVSVAMLALSAFFFVWAALQ